MKVFITRDESDDWVWVWKNHSGKVWEPFRVKGCDVVMYQRGNGSLEDVDAYLSTDFKKKFGISIKQKTKKCIQISKKLLDSEDYKLISDNSDRKK